MKPRITMASTRVQLESVPPATQWLAMAAGRQNDQPLFVALGFDAATAAQHVPVVALFINDHASTLYQVAWVNQVEPTFADGTPNLAPLTRTLGANFDVQAVFESPRFSQQFASKLALLMTSPMSLPAWLAQHNAIAQHVKAAGIDLT